MGGGCMLNEYLIKDLPRIGPSNVLLFSVVYVNMSEYDEE